jgi:predicted ATP-grasp superfamily ATP-dependent carboligase
MAEAPVKEVQTEEKKEVEEEEEELPIFLTRPKVAFTKKYGSLKYVEFQKASRCIGATMYECLPDSGVTTEIIGNILQKQLKLELIGMGWHTDFPALGVVLNGTPSPAFRVYGHENIILVTCAVSVHKKNAKVCNNIVECLFDMCKRLQCPALVTSENLLAEDIGKKKETMLEHLMKKPDMERMTSEDIRKSHEGTVDMKKAYYLTNSESAGQLLHKTGLKVFNSAKVMGVTGVLLQHMLTSDVDITAVLVPTNKKFPDGWGAVTLGHLLNLLIPSLNFDVKTLEDEAVRVEKTVHSAVSEYAKAERKKNAPSEVTQSMFM